MIKFSLILTFLSFLAALVLTGAQLGSDFLPNLYYFFNKEKYQDGIFQVESISLGKTEAPLSYRGSGRKLIWKVRGNILEHQPEQQRSLNAFDLANYQQEKQQGTLTSFLQPQEKIAVFYLPDKKPFSLNQRDLTLISQQAAQKISASSLFLAAFKLIFPWLICGCIVLGWRHWLKKQPKSS